MEIVITLLVGCFFSYIGSIPPGTINISVVQFALKKQFRDAFYFAFAAAFVEFFYAGFAVAIHLFYMSKIDLNLQFKIIAGCAMLILGIVNLFRKDKPKPLQSKPPGKQGFRSGVIISIFNPLAIPFWLAVTAYLESQHWIMLNSETFIFYIIGISTGTFLLLCTLIIVVNKFKINLENHPLVNKVTGVIFIVLGIYTFTTLL